MSNSLFGSVSQEAAYHRAGGRRRYNFYKQWKMIQRQDAILAHLLKDPFCGGSPFYGFTTRLAKLFGVSRQTIHRDISALIYPWRPQSFVRVIDAKLNYGIWWERIGKHSSLWTEAWFGNWWEQALIRNEDHVVWKRIGENKYKQDWVRAQSRGEH